MWISSGVMKCASPLTFGPSSFGLWLLIVKKIANPPNTIINRRYIPASFTGCTIGSSGYCKQYLMVSAENHPYDLLTSCALKAPNHRYANTRPIAPSIRYSVVLLPFFFFFPAILILSKSGRSRTLIVFSRQV